MPIPKRLAPAVLSAGALIAALGYFTWRTVPLPQAPIATAPTASPGDVGIACDLNSAACPVPVAAGHGMLDIAPRPLATMQPLQVTWREPAGADHGEAVHLQFEGVEMAMGFNRIRLTRTAAGVYSGTAMLPVCTTGSMRWRAVVDRGDGRPGATIEFVAPRPR